MSTPEELARRSSWYEHNGPTVDEDERDQLALTAADRAGVPANWAGDKRFALEHGIGQADEALTDVLGPKCHSCGWRRFAHHPSGNCPSSP